MEKCHKCQKPLQGKFCQAMNHNYHPQCFTCHKCNRPLTGTQFHVLDGKPICADDYRKSMDKCSVCRQPITERSLTALGNMYHPDCFKCSVCQKPVIGQKFYTDDNKQIYCFSDYGKKNAKICNGCKQSIMPSPGQSESKWVVAMEKHYHAQCYKCQDCGLLLSSTDNDRQCYPVGDRILCLKCNIKRKSN